MEGRGLRFGVYGYGSGVKLLGKYHRNTKSIKREKKSALETSMKL